MLFCESNSWSIFIEHQLAITWESTSAETLTIPMVLDFFECDSVERSQCFGDVGEQNIGTSQGFATMAVREC